MERNRDVGNKTKKEEVNMRKCYNKSSLDVKIDVEN